MNIKDYIRDEISKGFTFDQIAQAMTRALNEAEEEHNKSKEVDKYLDECFDAVCAALDTSNVGYDTVGKLAAIAYANCHNNSKVEELKAFATIVEEDCGRPAEPIGKPIKKVMVKLEPENCVDVIERFLRGNGIK